MQRRKHNGMREASSAPEQLPSNTAKTRDGELLEWKDLPGWQRDNEYIVTSYRRASNSLRRSFRSVLRIHNETVNIWTHLIGAIVFTALPLYAYSLLRVRYQLAASKDIAALGTFFMGVAVCFMLSTIFHTCANHSKKVWILTNQLDYLGIVIVIWGSSVSSDFFGFYCDKELQLVYWTMATSSAVGCGIFTLTSNFRRPAYRLVRFGVYSLLGLSAFVPVIHGILINGWKAQDQRMSISYFLGLATLNFTGASIYAARIPERWYPRTFDILGSSHQIMHILVVCGALSHTTGLIKAFDYWHARRGVGNDVCAE